MAKVVVSNLCKRFGNNTVVPDLSLDIGDREFVVLVGPSGCGKTTVLRMIAGLETPDGGDIYIANVRVNDLHPKDRDVAMVFQNYALYPHMTVYDNMAFSLQIKKLDKKEIDLKIRESAAMLGLENLLKRKPKELSGGQRQRVALGRAIVREPQVFLMDEPLSNLDAHLRAQTRTELKRLHGTLQNTIIYVTHDQIEAMTMGDRLVVMRDGVIQQVDTPVKIYSNPSNLFVASFIGSPRMNFISVKLIDKDGGTCFVSENLCWQLPRGSGYPSLVPDDYVIGIRPEDISVGSKIVENRDFDVRDKILIDVVEPVGSEVYLHGMYNGFPMIISARAGDHFVPGTVVEFAIRYDKIHLFFERTGERIGDPA